MRARLSAKLCPSHADLSRVSARKTLRFSNDAAFAQGTEGRESSRKPTHDPTQNASLPREARVACSLLDTPDNLERSRSCRSIQLDMTMRGYLRRLLPYVRPYGRLAAASLALMIGVSLIG